MPGRGDPWREGGHIDDTILSEDIKDGTITEADLDTALTDKINTGGGSLNKKDLGTCDEWYVYDDMIHPTKAGVLVHWQINPNLASETFSVPIAKGGVIRLGTNTGAGNNATNCLTCAGGGAPIMVGGDFLFRDRIKLLSIDDNMFWTGGMAPQFPQGNNADTVASADSGGGGIADNAVMFRYDGNGTDGPNIQCITRSGGFANETKVDSGVAMDTAYHCYDVESDGTNVIFKIDGNQVADITTNIPTGTNLIVGEQLNSIATANSDDRKMDIDMMFLYSTTRE